MAQERQQVQGLRVRRTGVDRGPLRATFRAKVRWPRIWIIGVVSRWVAQHSPRCQVKGTTTGKKGNTLASEACPLACAGHGANPCADAPLRDDLGNVDCVQAAVQSATDVSHGAVGLLEAGLDPIPNYNDAGMCTVNVHWHIGAEHRSEGEYDESCAFDLDDDHHDHRSLRGDAGAAAPRRLAGGRVGPAVSVHDALRDLKAEIAHEGCAAVAFHGIGALTRAHTDV